MGFPERCQRNMPKTRPCRMLFLDVAWILHLNPLSFKANFIIVEFFVISGPFCNLEVTSCNPNPCNEGGSCYVDSLGVYCVCKPGFEGLFCELSSESEGGE